MKKLQEILNANGAKLEVDGVIGSRSLTALHQYVKTNLEKRKWVMPKDGFVWIRTDKTLTNTFDDFVAVYKNGLPIMALPCSTTAGDFYVFNPLTVGGITGTAIAAEQQVLGSHRFVTSRNWKSLWLNAPYFQQILPITIYRDGNKDRVLDKKVNQFGLFGINFHRAGLAAFINKWSAGCHVAQDNNWFEVVKLFTNGQVIDYTMFEV
jgi:hypothetical protein